MTSVALVAASAAVTGVGASTTLVSSRARAAVLLSAGATAIGSLPPQAELQADVELRPRDATALARFATDVSTPGDSVYGHFLAPAQFATRFGPTATALASVRRWLSADGLSVTDVSSNHLTVGVRGTAASFEHAFVTGIERYRLPGGRVAYANTASPLIPVTVRGTVEGVLGLDDAVSVQAASLAPASASAHMGRTPHASSAGPAPCTAAVQAGESKHAYTADQLANAYDISGLYADGDEGSGVTVGLFELGPNLPGDVTAYQACFGTHAAVSYLKVDGGSGTGAGDGEAALDIETAIGIAPKASFVVYQAPRTQTGIIDDFTAMIDADTAKVITTSWGECEATSSSTLLVAEATLFEQAATQGQSVFAATGDYGASDCQTSALTVDDPASQPFVTGVGGTTLSAIGPPPVETAWNDSRIKTGAGGGGVSSLHAMPSYQSDAAASLRVVSTSSTGSPCHLAAGLLCREVPDVAADADRSTGYLIYFNGAWSPNGGTSAATPLWAGLMALVDASSACGGRTIGFANPSLYQAASTSYGADFHDITAGNIDYSPYGNTSELYPATVGYDMATGLGTPIGTSLASTLCSLRTTVAVASSTSLRASKASVTFGSEKKERFSVIVAGHASDGRPLGRVNVFSATKRLCTAVLTRRSASSATGSCVLTQRELAIGRYADVYASYAPAGASSSNTRVRYTLSRSSHVLAIRMLKPA